MTDRNRALVQHLLCPLCLDVYRAPVVSPCGHSYCATCGGDAISRNRSCPVCMKPVAGEQALSPNIALRQVVEALATEKLQKELQDAAKIVNQAATDAKNNEGGSSNEGATESDINVLTTVLVTRTAEALTSFKRSCTQIRGEAAIEVARLRQAAMTSASTGAQEPSAGELFEAYNRCERRIKELIQDYDDRAAVAAQAPEKLPEAYPPAPPSCFAAKFAENVVSGGAPLVENYFTCKNCSLNWLCSTCSEICHAAEGHTVVPYVVEHTPEYAACYCKRSKCCKLKV